MKRNRTVLLIGLLLVALNFRPAITSIPPVLEAIRADLGLSYTAVSLLTTVPTLLIGIFAFSAAPVSRLLGRERAILWATVLVGVGTALRVWGATAIVLFGTTVSIGIGIAISQTLLPSIVNDYFPERAALVTGLYTTSLGIGAAVAAGGTAPLTGVLGSWPRALAVWAVLAGIAAAVWAPISRSDDAGSRGAQSTQKRLPWRHTGAWITTLFFSAQTLLYYSELTWLAPLYVDLGWGTEQAGFVLTLFVIAQLGGSLGIPALADRWTDRRPWLVLAGVLNAIGLGGFVWFPFVSPWGWGILTGIGMGGLFALGLTLPSDLAPNADAAGRLTAMMIGVGYVVGAVGPVAIGGARDLLGSYGPSFIVLLGLNVAMLVTMLWFRPNRSVS
ncbi:CynX/NimT family MFS transporter [Natrinema longum]|uniref:MFS transporter n=1 Tax=Natrinema longum TaxID=370324 RepID=A0A8A2U747_9EURY|nr:MFS transporter [Natrinema longum]MBZ6494149.1 MFS transporter [Natrinema longum]QSW84521.1 MFS transporter [Natrinema longum]